jgi:hypothetical protein
VVLVLLVVLVVLVVLAAMEPTVVLAVSVAMVAELD